VAVRDTERVTRSTVSKGKARARAVSAPRPPRLKMSPL
jgi:hypothetical protein